MWRCLHDPTFSRFDTKHTSFDSSAEPQVADMCLTTLC